MERKICIYFAIITLLNLNVSARNIMKTNSYFLRENDMHDEYFAGKESLKIPALAENAGECEYKNGFCERNEAGKMVCKCPPEWGLYEKKLCKKCDCGKDANCTWEGSFIPVKHCICKGGYKDVNGTCKEICAVDKCKNGGTCLKNGTCSCPPMTKGDACEIADCSSTAPGCAGTGATCKYDETGRTSYCDCGQGRRYDTEKNECEGECKCQNGFCERNEAGKMVCKCPLEWGLYEEKMCKQCDCGKDANCTWEGSFIPVKHCICKAGFKDVNGTCKDACTPNPCLNGGKCRVSSGKANCTCIQGFSGTKCEYDVCTPNPCLNSGACKVFNGKANCMCGEGFSGEMCEIDVCTRNLCLNGGVCKVFNGKANCMCREGFTGEMCEYGVCTPNPCLNGGVCKVFNGKAKCLCRENVVGEMCEIDICSENPCKNGGTCKLIDGRAGCICKDGYSGDFCENDPCTPDPCEIRSRMRATCVIQNGKAVCEYGMQFSGAEYERDQCSVYNCKNGGICREVHHRPRCFCISPFYGEFCEKDASKWDKPSASGIFATPRNSSSVPDYVTSTSAEFNAMISETFLTSDAPTSTITTTGAPTLVPDLCSLFRCMNGGICREINYRPRCFCLSPFSGKFCEKDPCTSRPCVNGGTCVIKNAKFHCNCNEPFTGDFCEKDPCTENPCQNDGTCLLSGYTFKCICKDAFTGDKCESSIVKDRYMMILAALSLLIVPLIVVMTCLIFRRCMSKGG